MPFGKKLPEQERAESHVSEAKQIASIKPINKGPAARNLSNGPPGSNLPIKKSQHPLNGPSKKRSSESVDDRAEWRPVSDQINKKITSKIEQRMIDAIDQPDGRKRCAECGATETSTWRRDPSGSLICNKCGLRKRKDHKAPSRRSAQRTPKVVEKQPSRLEDISDDVSESHTLTEALQVDPRPPRPWANMTRISAVDHAPPNLTEIASADEAMSDALSNAERTSSLFPISYVATSKSPAMSHQSSPSDFATILPPYAETLSQKVPVVTNASVTRPSTIPSTSVAAARSVPPATIDEIIEASQPNPSPTRKKSVNPRTLEPKVCFACGTDESPAWRKDKQGNSMCNKCLLRQKRRAERPYYKPGNANGLATAPNSEKWTSARLPTSTALNSVPQNSNGRPCCDVSKNSPGQRGVTSSHAWGSLHESRDTHIMKNKYDGGFNRDGTLSKALPRKILPAPSSMAPAVTPGHSFYGSSSLALDRSTAIVSRADLPTVAKHISHFSGGLPVRQAHAVPIGTSDYVLHGSGLAPEFIWLEGDGPAAARPRSPPGESNGLDPPLELTRIEGTQPNSHTREDNFSCAQATLATETVPNMTLDAEDSTDSCSTYNRPVGVSGLRPSSDDGTMSDYSPDCPRLASASRSQVVRESHESSRVPVPTSHKAHQLQIHASSRPSAGESGTRRSSDAYADAQIRQSSKPSYGVGTIEIRSMVLGSSPSAASSDFEDEDAPGNDISEQLKEGIERPVVRSGSNY